MYTSFLRSRVPPLVDIVKGVVFLFVIKAFGYRNAEQSGFWFFDRGLNINFSLPYFPLPWNIQMTLTPPGFTSRRSGATRDGKPPPHALSEFLYCVPCSSSCSDAPGLTCVLSLHIMGPRASSCRESALVASSFLHNPI